MKVKEFAFGKAYDKKGPSHREQVDEAVATCLKLIRDVKEAYEGVEKLRKELDNFNSLLPLSCKALKYTECLKALRKLWPRLQELYLSFGGFFALHQEQGSVNCCEISIWEQRESTGNDMSYVEREIEEVQRQIEALKTQTGGNLNKVLWTRPQGKDGKAAARDKAKHRLWRQPLEYDPAILFAGPGWQPLQALGGGMSVANLWVNLDDHENVRGRL